MKKRRINLSSYRLNIFFLVCFIFLLSCWSSFIYAVPIPDGMKYAQSHGITIYARGDEHFCQFYVKGPDDEGYTVIKNKLDGQWYFATIQKDTGKVIPSSINVNKAVIFPIESKNLLPEGKVLLQVKSGLEKFNKKMDEINKGHLEMLNEKRESGQRTTYQVHILFVEFPDVDHIYEAKNFLKMIFSDKEINPYVRTPNGYQAYGSARDYWDEVSRGEMNIEPIVHYPIELAARRSVERNEWFMMPLPRASYTDNDQFYDAVINESGIMLNPEDKLIIVAAGRASGFPFWPHVDCVGGNRMLLTERFRINGEHDRFLPMGVAAHEFGHMLLGLPDYAYSVSYWGIMGMGCFGFGNSGTPNPEKPVHLSAIGRIRAGFADIETISAEGIVNISDYELTPVESTGKILHLVNEDNDSDFYLEYRQSEGNVFDSDIKGDSSGLVVWYTFEEEEGYFPYEDDWNFHYFYPQKVGYLDSSADGQLWPGYLGSPTKSAFPGLEHNTEIGYYTIPSFRGNSFANIHHISNIRKGLGSEILYAAKQLIPQHFPASIEFDLERFYFDEDLRIISMDDDNEGMSQGDGDGVPEVGEHLEVIFTIENKGSQAIPASEASFVSLDEGLGFLDGSEFFHMEEILPGDSIEISALIEIIAPPASEEFYFIELLQNNQFSLPRTRLWVSDRDFQISSHVSDDTVPEIFENKIVWMRGHSYSHNADIYLYNLGPDGIPGTDDEGEGEYLLTLGPNNQTIPAIYDNKIVWAEYAGDYSNIYLYNLGLDGVPFTGDEGEEKYQITFGLASRYSPSIYENKIVYEDDFDICLYHLGPDGIPGTNDAGEGDYRLTSDSIFQMDSSIHSDKIVWLEERGTLDIFLYYLGPDGIPFTADEGEGEYRITSDYAQESNISIHGNKIVWREAGSGGSDSDIFLYNLGPDGIPFTNDEGEGEYQINFDSVSQFDPAIYGNKIVYRDNRNGNSDIFLYNLGPDGIPGTGDQSEGERQIVYGSPEQQNPAIYNEHVVWEDKRNGNWDIYLGIFPE